MAGHEKHERVAQGHALRQPAVEHQQAAHGGNEHVHARGRELLHVQGLQCLLRGGRIIGAAAGLVAALLRIRPLLGVLAGGRLLLLFLRRGRIGLELLAGGGDVAAERKDARLDLVVEEEAHDVEAEQQALELGAVEDQHEAQQRPEQLRLRLDLLEGRVRRELRDLLHGEVLRGLPNQRHALDAEGQRHIERHVERLDLGCVRHIY
mmetsp:Transcript_91858/g.237038  ORF Transcript_91858/g.237038 Transcript_91858/m.237038 type:complete len:207 (+) Transcript_91858:455-1075(+)